MNQPATFSGVYMGGRNGSEKLLLVPGRSPQFRCGLFFPIKRHGPCDFTTILKPGLWTNKTLSIQVCPKEGIDPTILLRVWDWDHQTYSREGYGSLGKNAWYLGEISPGRVLGHCPGPAGFEGDGADRMQTQHPHSEHAQGWGCLSKW